MNTATAEKIKKSGTLTLRWEENDSLLRKKRSHILANLTKEAIEYIVKELIPMRGVRIRFFIDDRLGNTLYFDEIR